MTPTCPQFYYCTFTPQHRYVVYQHLGPWWNGTWGWIVALLLGAALLALLGFVAQLVADGQSAKRQRVEREAERRNKLALEEQRTMQAEQCKGNPELLKILRADR